MKTVFKLSIRALLLSTAFQVCGEDFANTPKLVVRGEASIFKPADQMEASLGVVTLGDNSAAALKENKQRVAQVEANLKSAGLDENDYKTGTFRIRPIYEKFDKDPSVESDKIKSYEALNSIFIKTKKIQLADKIIEAAVQGGANQIKQVNFNLYKPQSYRAEAIRAAAQDALDQASALAAAMNVELKRPLNMSIEFWRQPPGPILFSKGINLRGGQNEEMESDALVPGNAEIHGVVNATFEIH